MARLHKTWGILSIFVTLIAIILLLIDVNETKESAWQIVQNELLETITILKSQNQLLKSENTKLEKLNTKLKKYLEEYESKPWKRKETSAEYYQIQSLLPSSLPDDLNQEHIEIRKLYRELLSEKNRWDRYRQEQYKHILESTIEPLVVDSQSFNLKNEENREFFIELEEALNLHSKFIRDVRLFHDEIQYQKKQFFAEQQYKLFDLKFKLNNPFAREAALTDGLLQAMSALSAGIYQHEATEVLNRIGKEFTRPIRQIYEHLQDSTDTPVPIHHNFNVYMVHGKKLIDYSDSLVQQSSIPLAPSAFGELDFFSRRLLQTFFDLYQVGQSKTIGSTHLDLEKLQQAIHAID